MKNLKFSFILIFHVILIISCDKGEETYQITTSEFETLSDVPHFNENNTLKVTWDDIPDELKNARVYQPEESENIDKTYSYLDGFYGGYHGGDVFYCIPNAKDKIHTIIIQADHVIESMKVYYKDPNGKIYLGFDKGGIGTQSPYYIHEFKNSEFIKSISGRSGDYLNQISIRTNKKVFTYGGYGGNPFDVQVQKGFQILGFYGRAGDIIDQIGFYVYRRK